MNNNDEDKFNYYRYSLVAKIINDVDSEHHDDYKEDFLNIFSSFISNKIGTSIYIRQTSYNGTCEFSVSTDDINYAIKLREFVEYLDKENKFIELISHYIDDGSRLGLTKESEKLYNNYELCKKTRENYFKLHRELPLNSDKQSNNKKIKL